MAKIPAKKRAPESPLTRLRKICLALPEAHEVEAWEAPTFRVKNKIFAMYADEGNHHHDGRPAVWIKSKHVVQEILLQRDPKRYFKPPYVGPGGWTGAFLDGRPNWTEIAALIEDAYRQTAPKKLIAKLGD
jgi:hypothetical protein